VTPQYTWDKYTLQNPPVNLRGPCQIGVGRIISPNKMFFSGSMLIYQRVVNVTKLMIKHPQLGFIGYTSMTGMI
jgi:hypothetical protein